ncbi:MAG: DUF6434 domain-containing protein [Bacteroidota bacterium]
MSEGSRPSLTTALSAADFRDYYWLKTDLVTFCRAEGLPTAGRKAELVERVAAYLHDGTVLPPAPAPRGPADPMPDVLTPETIIGRGWTCGARLRAFFVAEVGPSFRFNRALIDAIKGGAGRTLGEALAIWTASEADPDRPIEASLEFNQHQRAFAKAHPGAGRAEMMAAWQRKRASRRSDWT